MKIWFFLFTVTAFVYGHYTGVEVSIKSETKTYILESALYDGHNKCVEKKI